MLQVWCWISTVSLQMSLLPISWNGWDEAKQASPMVTNRSNWNTIHIFWRGPNTKTSTSLILLLHSSIICIFEKPKLLSMGVDLGSSRGLVLYPIDAMLKCYTVLITWSKKWLARLHIWKFYDSISLCWTIFWTFRHFSVVMLSATVRLINFDCSYNSWHFLVCLCVVKNVKEKVMSCPNVKDEYCEMVPFTLLWWSTLQNIFRWIYKFEAG